MDFVEIECPECKYINKYDSKDYECVQTIRGMYYTVKCNTIDHYCSKCGLVID